MAECEFLSRCCYLKNKLKNMPAATKMIKSMYCLWHYEECARYRIAEVLGLENIPSDLFPADTKKAEAILS